MLGTGREAAGNRASAARYTLTEAIVAIFVSGIIVVALLGSFCGGFSLVRLSRENLRATQILLQKTESVRIYSWAQIVNTKDCLQDTFTDYFNPDVTDATRRGTTYEGSISSEEPASLPSDYRASMRLVTISVSWTNAPTWPRTNRFVHTRQMQTYIARH